MERHRIPSISACIIKGNSIVWKGSYGHADRERGIPATSETIYMLASTSKQVTSVAVMQLHEKGLIDIDKDINSYLPFKVRNPNFPDLAITPRILLAHRSGLAWPEDEDPSFYRIYPKDTAPVLGKWLENYITPAGNNFHSKIWKKTRSGETELYSNIGAALLGYLVESVSSKDFNAFCKENIFTPLNMNNASFRISDLETEKVAMPYYEDLSPCGHYGVPFYPSTTLRSSVDDFSHFVIAMMNGGIYKGKRILKDSTVNEILRIQYANSWCGLLWWKYSGGWYGGQGGFLGASSFMAFKKKDNIGILILSNRTEFDSFYPPEGKIFTLVRDKTKQIR
jgi:CubicO group peptidase (beta-lactamase class C family)